jgi:hypothetical protein
VSVSNRAFHTPSRVQSHYGIGLLCFTEYHRRILGGEFGRIPKPIQEDAFSQGGYCIDAHDLLPAGSMQFHSFGPGAGRLDSGADHLRARRNLTMDHNEMLKPVAPPEPEYLYQDFTIGGAVIEGWSLDQLTAHSAIYLERIRVLVGEVERLRAEAIADGQNGEAARLIDLWAAKHGKPMPWHMAVELVFVVNKLTIEQRDTLLALDDDRAAAAIGAVS